MTVPWLAELKVCFVGFTCRSIRSFLGRRYDRTWPG